MWRWLLRAVVSSVVVGVLLTLIPLHTVLAALRRVSLWTWAASLGVFVGGHYLNALKLRMLLGPERASRSACVRAQYAGLAANLGLPGLAGGDLVRAAYLAPTAGTKQVALASVADRIVDTLTLVVVVAVALPLAGVPPAIARIVWRGGEWVAAAVAIGAVLAGVMIGLRKYSGISERLARVAAELGSRRAALAGAAAISLVVQPAFVLTNAWLAGQVGVAIGMAPWFVAWPLSKLVAVLPISLGGIGVREAALVTLLAPYGAPRESVLASGILWQAVLAVSGLAGFLVTQMVPRPVLPTMTPAKAPSGEA